MCELVHPEHWYKTHLLRYGNIDLMLWQLHFETGNFASWMHWITKAETCSRLALWCTLFSLYKMQKMYEVYVHLWVIYLWAVLKVLLNYFHIQWNCRLNHTNYVTYSVWFFFSFCRRRSEEYLYGIWVTATSSCSHMVRNTFTWCHIPSIT